MSLERILICPCGHYLEWHGRHGCVAPLRGNDELRCACMLTRPQIVDALVRVERDEIRAQWADLRAEPQSGRSAG